MFDTVRNMIVFSMLLFVLLLIIIFISKVIYLYYGFRAQANITAPNLYQTEKPYITLVDISLAAAILVALAAILIYSRER